MNLTEEQKTHLTYLNERIYQCDTKWPQFKIMMKAAQELIAEMKESDKILILERAYFFGGYSIFSPLFSGADCTTVDCVNETAAERFGAQASWTEGPGFIREKADFTAEPAHIDRLQSGSYDVIFVPNIVHHIKDQKGMIAEWARLLKPGGNVLIFEGLVRELHHIPDDYLRYTPFGFEAVLKEAGLTLTKTEYGSGVFDVLAYTWQQALDFLPEEVRKEKEKWFWEQHYPELQELDRLYPANLKKKDKSFPMSYVLWVTK